MNEDDRAWKDQMDADMGIFNGRNAGRQIKFHKPAPPMPVWTPKPDRPRNKILPIPEAPSGSISPEQAEKIRRRQAYEATPEYRAALAEQRRQCQIEESAVKLTPWLVFYTAVLLYFLMPESGDRRGFFLLWSFVGLVIEFPVGYFLLKRIKLLRFTVYASNILAIVWLILWLFGLLG